MRDVRGQRREVEVVPAVERQRIDLLRRNRRGGFRTPRFDERRGHVHRLGNASGPEHHRKVHLGANGKRQIRGDGAETIKSNRQTVLADRQIPEREPAACVGGRLRGLIRCEVPELNSRAGNDRIACVANGAGHAGRREGLRGQRRGQRERTDESQPYGATREPKSWDYPLWARSRDLRAVHTPQDNPSRGRHQLVKLGG